jgi:hypothetical protein
VILVVDEEEMSSTMVLKLKPVATKKIIAAPSSLKQKPMIIKPVRNNNFDHHKIAERVPIDDVSYK